jgi:oligoribonuclease NrnB/cAMP/cGMP phosphodiesterase (DHH superfamily)
MKRILISHIDLDGVSALVVAKYLESIGKEHFDNYYALNYDFHKTDVWSEILTASEILMTDLSLPKDAVEEILSKGIKISIWDHHEAAKDLQDIVHPNFKMTYSENLSGGKLFLESYGFSLVGRIKQSLVEFVDLCDTYDLWKIDHPLWPRALGLNQIMYRYQNWKAQGLAAMDTFINTMLKRILIDNVFNFTESENFVIQEEMEKEDRYFDSAVKDLQLRKDAKGAFFGLTKLPGKISIVASRILQSEENSCLDYLIVCNSFKGLTGKISARSARGFNCNLLSFVKGHDAAAGGEITPDQIKMFWENENLVPAYKEDGETIMLIDSVTGEKIETEIPVEEITGA